MKIVLATDHAGFELKEKIKQYLINNNIEVKDFGAFVYDKNDDYPDFIFPAAKYVSDNSNVKGIIFGGSGQGEAISANRILGVRAAVYYGSKNEIIDLSRQHNDANILSMGARFISKEEAIEAINSWLKIEFEGGRHKRRIEKLDKIQ